MKNEIRNLTESEVVDVSGALPAWLIAAAAGIATNAIYDGLKEAGVFRAIDLRDFLRGR